MKSNSWKKEWVVISFSDYDNKWSELTIPLTFKQASDFIHHGRYTTRMNKGLVAMVTVSEFARMQDTTTWKHDAPFNSQFLGAQRPQACQDY
jgi:hypothetical protein